jgi:hypothetical protein
VLAASVAVVTLTLGVWGQLSYLHARGAS